MIEKGQQQGEHQCGERVGQRPEQPGDVPQIDPPQPDADHQDEDEDENERRYSRPDDDQPHQPDTQRHQRPALDSRRRRFERPPQEPVADQADDEQRQIVADAEAEPVPHLATRGRRLRLGLGRAGGCADEIDEDVVAQRHLAQTGSAADEPGGGRRRGAKVPVQEQVDQLDQPGDEPRVAADVTLQLRPQAEGHQVAADLRPARRRQADAQEVEVLADRCLAVQQGGQAEGMGRAVDRAVDGDALADDEQATFHVAVDDYVAPGDEGVALDRARQSYHVAKQDHVVVHDFAGGDGVATEDGLGQRRARRPGHGDKDQQEKEDDSPQSLVRGRWRHGSLQWQCR